jgi:ketosteroid isomerase-like protein
MEFKEFDRCLSDAERLNVAAAYDMIDAIRGTWSDPQTGWRPLESLLASDFISFTPTSDPDRQQQLDKQAFIDSIRDQSSHLKPESQLEIVAHTAHGNRVATETNSEVLREDGSTVRIRYHQLFLFDSPGRIAQYRTYMDSAAVVDSAIARGEALVRNFVTALGAASPELGRLAAKGFEFEPADGSAPLGVAALLAKITALREKAKAFHLNIIENGLIVDQGIASVELQSSSGSQHCLVIAFDGDHVTSASEFSSGILEINS